MIIELLNGIRIDVEEKYGLKRLFHRIPSLTVEHLTEAVEARGDLIIGTEFNQRNITVTLLYFVNDICSYDLLRDELNALLVRNEPFYIIFKREHWKRYKVRLAQQLEMEPNNKAESFDVLFRTENLFGESIGTSLDLQNKDNWDSDLWGFGAGIDYDTKYQYTFNKNDFIVKNIGNQTINPRQSDFDIILKGRFSNYVQITNHTTGDVYRFNGNLTSTDTLRLTGIRTLKNSLSRFRDTNHNILTLAPGDNRITVEGGTVESMNFDFRFLYK
ncbi:distal tail protein Dit [Solibacillus sp. FSL K6-1523]|uniref:distal tail protein Dit n=1 Tax=Solibacillus sp. FSL K6-1523 TaxID=2921471 RepID=UPI0030FBF74B